MRTLNKRFRRRKLRKLTAIGWVKLVIFFPVLAVLFVANEVINFTAFMLSALFEYFRHSSYEAQVFRSRCYNTISNEVPYRIHAHRDYRD